MGTATSFVWSGSYDGIHVMVTGGSSGIGLEIAREYIKRGANITIVARTESRLIQAVKDLENSRINQTQIVLFCSVDAASNELTVSEALKPAIDRLGPVEILVNCMGTSSAATFEDTPGKEFENLFNTNVMGSVLPTKFVVPGMKSRKRGRVIFVASQIAFVGIHGFTAYAASKWALRGLAETLQMELKPYNIIVSVAYPPDTDTPGYANEMLTKPDLTKRICESGFLYPAPVVAKAIVDGSTVGQFGISIGLDGWFMKQSHPGMSPLNSAGEVLAGIIFAPLSRI
eukprot:gene13507-28651_t